MDFLELFVSSETHFQSAASETVSTNACFVGFRINVVFQRVILEKKKQMKNVQSFYASLDYIGCWVQGGLINKVNMAPHGVRQYPIVCPHTSFELQEMC